LLPPVQAAPNAARATASSAVPVNASILIEAARYGRTLKDGSTGAGYSWSGGNSTMRGCK
jgi:hypothetical protein